MAPAECAATRAEADRAFHVAPNSFPRLLLGTATLDKWARFPAAKDWLDKTLLEQTASVQRAFDEFLQADNHAGSPARSPEERRQLFEEYLKWTRSSMGVPNQPARP